MSSGLVPVPIHDPEFCVQPYESSITEDGTVTANSGETPDVHVSFREAKAACEKTVFNGRPMRLINHREWKKAGGGERYPWGDSYESRCVLDSKENHGLWSSVQPSGSMPECVEYGVYDQLERLGVGRYTANSYTRCRFKWSKTMDILWS